MKNLLYLLILLPIASFAQLPNGSFENWTFNNDDEEIPDDWMVNTFNQGTVVKSAIAVDGEFSIFMMNNEATNSVNAQTQFVPTGIVNKLTGQIRVDPTTIQDGAFITVSGWTENNYSQLGQVHIHEVTTGFMAFEVPLELPATALDSVRVSIDVGPAPIVIGIAVGFGRVYLDQLALIDSTVVSTNTINPDDQIQIYPNPATNQVQIKSNLSSPVDVQVFDLNGKLILQQKAIRQNHEIAINHLSNGVYILRCETTEGIVYEQKVVKF